MVDYSPPDTRKKTNMATLTKRATDRTSKTGSSPGYYEADDGTYVIQGWILNPDETAQLTNIADNETAVKIPANVVDQLIANELNRRTPVT